jgi:hypothetical protein
MLGDGGNTTALGGVGAGGYVCVGENCPFGDTSVSVTSESVAAWLEAPGRRGDGDGRMPPARASGGDLGDERLVRQENLSEPGR